MTEWIPAGHGTRAVLRDEARKALHRDTTQADYDELVAYGSVLRLDADTIRDVIQTVLTEKGLTP